MSTFALVDCNNFYASCERVFNPRLIGKPIIILSNNDGCIVARSNEAKQLGIPMGAPYFQWKKLCSANNVAVFSSNYELYGDMSQRIMSSIEKMCPDMEIYSIDETFLNLDNFKLYDLERFFLNMRKNIFQWTGVPVSIGYSQTKTLAKIANRIAKTKTTTGVFDLTNPLLQNIMLDKFPVDDIWGIGTRLTKKLNSLDIYTAKELRDTNTNYIREQFTVVMQRTVAELNRISCIPLEEYQPKKQIMSSRSFGTLITDLYDLEETISTYTATACVKLRQQCSLAQGIQVFCHTNGFRKNDKQYANAATYYFPGATSNTSYIISIAKDLLKKIYRKGFNYKKSGIMLLDLIPNHVNQLSLIPETVTKKNKLLMEVVDKINNAKGKKSIFFAAEGTNHRWSMKRKGLSPRYTTRLNEIVRVLA